MPLRTFIACSALLVLFAGPSQAFAQSPDETSGSTEQAARARAKALFNLGEAAYAQKEFGTALTLYKQAFEAWPLPGFQFNIGQCHRQMGDYAHAIEAFSLYLEQSPRAPNRKTVLVLLAKSKRAFLRHGGSPPPATAAPPPTPDPALDEVKPAPPLLATEEPSPPEKVAATASAPTSESQAVADVEESAPEPAAGHTVSPKWFWTATAATGLFVGLSIITGSMALARNHTFKDASISEYERQNAGKSGQTLQTVTNISLICGAGSALAAFVFWELRPSHSTGSNVSAAWVPGGVLLTKQGRF
jgi:tetratricopeptide (TPR) repeat protein